VAALSIGAVYGTRISADGGAGAPGGGGGGGGVVVVITENGHPPSLTATGGSPGNAGAGDGASGQTIWLN
jgi:hypothetical protein